MKHKLFLLLPTLIWAALPLSGSAAGTRGTLFDAAEQQPARLWKPEQKATCRNGLLDLHWDTGRNNICIVSFPRRKELPISAFDEANCRIELELPPNSPVNNFNLRFVDSRNEVFQWRIPFRVGKNGMRELNMKLTPENFFTSYYEKVKRLTLSVIFFYCYLLNSASKGRGLPSVNIFTVFR